MSRPHLRFSPPAAPAAGHLRDAQCHVISDKCFSQPGERNEECHVIRDIGQPSETARAV